MTYEQKEVQDLNEIVTQLTALATAIGLQANTTNAILAEIKKQYSEGLVNPFVDILTLASSSTFSKMYSNVKFVRKAVIQNITSSAGVMISIRSSLQPSGTTAGIKALQLNAGGSINLGGGSLEVGNIDLSKIEWSASLKNCSIAVYYEISNLPQTGIL